MQEKTYTVNSDDSDEAPLMPKLNTDLLVRICQEIGSINVGNGNIN